MDKMSITSILLVSFPEELLMLLTSLVLIGNRESLDFRNKKNFFKLLIASSIMTACAVIGRSLLPYTTANFILQLIIFYITFIVMYRYRIPASALATVLSFLTVAIGEVLILGPTLNLLNISIEQVYSNDFFRILISFPARFFQILVIALVCKKKEINLSMVKLSIDEWVQVTLFCFMVISSMVSMESGFRNINRDFGTILKLIINICIAIIFSCWMAYKIFKTKKESVLKQKIRKFELQRIKKLLLDGHTEHVLQLIELALKERG